jgi:hypothetical protein
MARTHRAATATAATLRASPGHRIRRLSLRILEIFRQIKHEDKKRKGSKASREKERREEESSSRAIHWLVGCLVLYLIIQVCIFCVLPVAGITAAAAAARFDAMLL